MNPQTVRTPKQSHLPVSHRTAPQSTELDPNLKDSLVRFSVKLLTSLKQDLREGQNLFASPVSVAMALSMLANGAKGATLEGIRSALEQNNMSLAEANNAIKGFSHILQNLGSDVKIRIANAIFPSVESNLVQSFEETLRNEFGSEVRALDYRNNGDAAVAVLNGFCEDKTEGMITKIIEQLPPETLAVLINAIYFKGMWQSKFDKTLTNDNQDFTTDTGAAVKVSLMQQTGKFSYFQADGLEVIKLPYGTGNASMLIVLPNESSSTSELVASMTADKLNSLIQSVNSERPTKGTIELPRFKTSYDVTLNGALSSLGMGLAFTDNADFSGMTEEQAKISKVIHKAVVDVNEEGTEAAAVTAIIMERCCVQLEQPWFMKVDRPFFMAIEHAGIPLFYGVINNPTI